MSFRTAQHRIEVDRIIKREARRSHVKLHRVANVGNHLHVFASFANHEGFKKFLRTVSGCIARLVTGARRGRPFGRRFWDHLAFSRVVTGGRRGFKAVDQYVEANQIEASFGWWERGLFQDSPARYRADLDDFVEMVVALERPSGGP